MQRFGKFRVKFGAYSNVVFMWTKKKIHVKVHFCGKLIDVNKYETQWCEFKYFIRSGDFI